MIKNFCFFFPIAVVLVSAGCTAHKKIVDGTGPTNTLKYTFKDEFLVGTAVNTQQIQEKDTAAARLITTQFNAVTPENCMKAAVIHPGWDSYDFSLADKLVEYAQKSHLVVNAHTLIWHSQLPVYMRKLHNADSVRGYFTNHINTLAARYDGKVFSWDVVNEALDEDGTMRKSIFLQLLGENYVVEAFRLAQKAAPHTKLYYNDYNIEQPKKRAGAIALIKKIQAAGVRIDGVGIQAHWHTYNLPLPEIEESIREFSALGIEVMFTELDLGVLPNPSNITGADISQQAGYNEKINPYKTGLPDAEQIALANAYKSLFDVFLKYKSKISRVTFWGVNDGQSWLNNFPVRGRTDYPLLFDREYKPKAAFYAVLQAGQN